MKRVVLIAPFVLLAACGNSGNAALSKTFNYGAPMAATTQETSAATSAQSSVSTTAAFSASPTAENGAAIASLALDLSASALGDATVAFANPEQVRGALIRAATATFDTCATTTATSVTFKNCSESESGFTVTLNGTITATAGHVSWGINAGFSGTDASSGVTVSISLNHAGDITVTDTKITGHAGSEFSGSASGQGQSASFGFATAVLFDLTYQTTPQACVTSGTIEVRRVWTQRPQGATGSAFADVGVKLIWSGCGTFQVAHST